MRWRFLECRTIVDSLTLLTFIIFLSLLNYKVKTFHFLQQNYEHTTFLLLLVTTSHPVAVPVGLFTLQSVAGTDTECWAGFYSLSPHIVAPAPCWRDSGSRDSGTIFWAGVGWGRADWARSWARLKKEKSNNRQKISLVAPQQPLKQQRRTHGQWELSDYCSSNSESLHT